MGKARGDMGPTAACGIGGRRACLQRTGGVCLARLAVLIRRGKCSEDTMRAVGEARAVQLYGAAAEKGWRVERGEWAWTRAAWLFRDANFQHGIGRCHRA